MLRSVHRASATTRRLTATTHALLPRAPPRKRAYNDGRDPRHLGRLGVGSGSTPSLATLDAAGAAAPPGAPPRRVVIVTDGASPMRLLTLDAANGTVTGNATVSFGATHDAAALARAAAAAGEAAGGGRAALAAAAAAARPPSQSEQSVVVSDQRAVVVNNWIRPETVSLLCRSGLLGRVGKKVQNGCPFLTNVRASRGAARALLAPRPRERGGVDRAGEGFIFHAPDRVGVYAPHGRLYATRRLLPLQWSFAPARSCDYSRAT